MAKVKVNPETCIGCNICVNTCPQGFEMDGMKAKVKDPEAACIEAAAQACPVDAIIVENDSATRTTQTAGATGSQRNAGSRSMGTGQGGGRGGSGQGPGAGSGPGGYCVCPDCGHREPHRRGQPCFEIRCPQCNTTMVRER